jgi:hypothetical protein
LLGRNAAKRAQKLLCRPAALAFIKTAYSGIILLNAFASSALDATGFRRCC